MLSKHRVFCARQGRRSISVLHLICALAACTAATPYIYSGANAAETASHRARHGAVHVVGSSMADDGGPFLGLGATYFTALWQFKYDRKRAESDLAFLSKQGFNYIRIFSMVGWNAKWKGLEIAPEAFTSRAGDRIDAWPDYVKQLCGLIDRAYDRYGLRVQITVFADAQLMPSRASRMAHLNRLLTEVLHGREQKIMLLEVANEAWQNGFPGEAGVQELRDYTAYLRNHTSIPIAITSNHEDSFEKLYVGSSATLATWHFSRDRKSAEGWLPVIDCWRLHKVPGAPPVISNEPIGPGSSVSSETDPTKLLAACAFAYTAGLPSYVFHSGAGVSGKTRFEDMPGILDFGRLARILPPDLASWNQVDSADANAMLSPDSGAPDSGCVKMICAQKGHRFVCTAVGIRLAGLQLRAQADMQLTVTELGTGRISFRGKKRKNDLLKLPQAGGALVIIGSVPG